MYDNQFKNPNKVLLKIFWSNILRKKHIILLFSIVFLKSYFDDLIDAHISTLKMDMDKRFADMELRYQEVRAMWIGLEFQMIKNEYTVSIYQWGKIN